jgi:hypothetical protein
LAAPAAALTLRKVTASPPLMASARPAALACKASAVWASATSRASPVTASRSSTS